MKADKNGGAGAPSGSATPGSSNNSNSNVIPKFMIGLTNKEKEEDFMAIKGTKLPVRPKKRAKATQRYLNLVSPGEWLSDLSLDRYEVAETKKKKGASNKKPKGLKAMMENMDSDSN